MKLSNISEFFIAVHHYISGSSSKKNVIPIIKSDTGLKVAEGN